MKKLLLTIILLFGLACMLWLGSSWLIGIKTEERVRQAFSKSETAHTTSGSVFSTHTSIDYQRTLFRAEAITRIDVRNTPLSAWVDELQFQHHIEHGPLLWDGKFDVADLIALKHEKLVLALSRWQTQLVTEGLDEDIQHLVETAFSGESPFLATSLINYEQTIAYQANLAPFVLVTEKDNQFQLGGVDFSGQFNLTTDQPLALVVSTGLLEFTHDKGRLFFPDFNVHAQMDTEQGKHAYEFSAPQSGLEITGQTDPISFAMQGTVDHQSSGEFLQGGVKLDLDNFTGMEYPLNSIAAGVDFSGINVEGLYAVNQLQNCWQDLRAQLVWNEEEIETPEARRDQTQLELAIAEITTQLLQGVFEQALQKNQSTLRYTLSVKTDLGDLSQHADLNYAGSERATSAEVMADYGSGDWLGLLRGDIKLDMAKEMMPADWQSWLDYPIERRALLDAGERYQTNVRLTGFDAELNHRVVDFDQLAGKFMPPLSGNHESDDRAITPAILALIEERGLNSEVLQQLSANGELSTGKLEILRQLQLMNEKLQ